MSIQQLVSLREKQAELHAAWYRQLLTLASGGLALLAGIGPEVPVGIGKYFLAGTWVFLGVGIVSGGAATYLQADLATKLTERFREELLHNLRENGQPTVTSLVSANPAKIFSWSKSVMVVSLLLAVCCLVTYAVLNTLQA